MTKIDKPIETDQWLLKVGGRRLRKWVMTVNTYLPFLLRGVEMF